MHTINKVRIREPVSNKLIAVYLFIAVVYERSTLNLTKYTYLVIIPTSMHYE